MRIALDCFERTTVAALCWLSCRNSPSLVLQGSFCTLAVVALTISASFQTVVKQLHTYADAELASASVRIPSPPLAAPLIRLLQVANTFRGCCYCMWCAEI